MNGLIDFKDYTQKAVRTLKPGDFARNLLHCALGLAGEMDEIAIALQNDDAKNAKEELGDAMWYAAVACNTLGLDMNAVVTEAFTRLTNNTQSSDLLSMTGCGVYRRGTANFVDHIKRAEFYGKPHDADELRSTLVWVIAGVVRMANVIDVTLMEIAEANIAKLQVRYPGQFSDFHATNRNLDKESEALNG